MSDEPRIHRIECGICDTAFTDGPVVEIADNVAQHWNDEHDDELAHDMTPYKTEEYGGRHIHGDEYAYTVHKYYITVYDVLDTTGATTGPFAYRYVKKPEAVDVCEDCWRAIRNVEGYQELDTDGWRDEYLCDECAHQRKVERRREENRALDAYATDGGCLVGGDDA